MLGSPKLLTLFLSVLDMSQQSRFSNFQFLFEIIKRRQKYPEGGPFCEFQTLVFWLEILFFLWLDTA